MNEYYQLLMENIHDNKKLEDYTNKHKTKLNLSRVLYEIKSNYVVPIKEYINIENALNDIKVVHNTSPTKLIEYIKDGSIRIDTVKNNMNYVQHWLDDKIPCYIGKDLWIIGLCEIKINLDFLKDHNFFISKNPNQDENQDLLIDYKMDLCDLDRFMHSFYVSVPNGYELITKTNHVFERPIIYITDRIPLSCIESIRCASSEVYHYLKNEINKIEGIDTSQFLELLSDDYEQEVINFKNLQLIAVEKIKEFVKVSDVDFYFHHEGYIYLYKKEFKHYIKIGTIDEYIDLLMNMVDIDKFVWADCNLPSDLKIKYNTIDDQYEVNHNVFNLFPEELILTDREISHEALRLFCEFHMKYSEDNPDVVNSLRTSLNDGSLREDILDIIKDDRIEELNDIDKEILVRVKLEGVKYVINYVESMLRSTNVEKYIDINYFFRRLFNLERYGLIYLDKENVYE